MRHAISLLLVFAGGAVGTLLRVGALALPLGPNEPVAMLAINVLGAFFLGLVVAAVRSTRLRLLLGTGLLGGFTSYSAMILLAGPGASGEPAWLGLGLAVLTVVAGTAAAALGLWLGARRAGGPASGGPLPTKPPLAGSATARSEPTVSPRTGSPTVGEIA